MACISSRDKLSQNEIDAIDSGQCSMCHFCEHSHFGKQQDGRKTSSNLEWFFLECRMSSNTRLLDDCDIFEKHNKNNVPI
jgi:hypothetical protein